MLPNLSSLLKPLKKSIFLSKPDEDKLTPSFSSILESRPDLEPQLKYLQDTIITPFLNRRVYENAGQLEEKLVKRLVIHGRESNDMQSVIIKAIRNEAWMQSKAKVHLVRIHARKFAICTNCNNSDECWAEEVKYAFNKAKKYETSIIYQEHLVPGVIGKSNSPITHAAKKDQLAAMKPGKTLLIDSVDIAKNPQAYDGFDMLCKDGVNYLHIPIHTTHHDRKTILTALTSKWDNLPGEDDLNKVEAKLAEIPVAIHENWDDILKNLTSSAYRLALERFTKSNGLTDADLIRGGDVRVEWQDWEDALVTAVKIKCEK